jgi:hypothetical protein
LRAGASGGEVTILIILPIVPSAIFAGMEGRHTACACYIKRLPVNGYGKPLISL